MINFALCDDNASILATLKEMLEKIFLKHDYKAKIAFSSTNPEELMKYIDNNNVDVLFLDIDLNSKFNGIEIAKQIREHNKSIYIIFITAHIEYVVSAYECKTFDFIYKPFNRRKLEKTIQRLVDDIRNNLTYFLNLSKSKQIINQRAINYIEKSGAKTIYNLNSGTVEVYGSFNQILNNLPKTFVRCHKSFIVNIENISKVDLKSSTIYFNSSPDSVCFIGLKYKNQFLEVLNNYGIFK